MKSGSEGSFHLPGEVSGTFISTPATAGPWGPEAQHGGPPSGLLTRALEAQLGPPSVLDAAEWGFMNTELTVHIVHEPVGDWVCFDAETSLVGTGVRTTTARVYDELGLVAHSAQALLIAPQR